MGFRAKTLFFNTTWMALGQVALIIAKIVSVPLIVALYGKEEYGIIVVVTAISNLLLVISAGLPTGIVRQAAAWIAGQEHEKLCRGMRTALTVFLLMGLLNAALLLLLAGPGAGLFKVSSMYESTFGWMLGAAALASMLTWYFSITEQLLQAYEDIAWLSRLNALPALLEITWVLSAGPLGIPFQWFFAGQLLLIAGVIPLKLLRLMKHMPVSRLLVPGWYWQESKEMFRISAGLFALAVSQNAVNQLRPIVLSIRASTGMAAAADFKILFQITELTGMLRGWFTNPLVPAITKAYIRGDHAFIERAVYTVTKIAWVISVFPIVMIAVCARDVLLAYVGEAGSGLHLWLTFWMASFMGLYLSPVTSVLFARGDVKPLVVFALSASLVSFALYWSLAPMLNVGATVVGNVFYNLANILFFHLYMLRRLELCPGRLLKTAFAGPFAAAVVTGLSVMMLRDFMIAHHHWVRLMVCGAAGLLIYAGLIFSLVMKPREFKRYLSDIRGA